VRIDASTGKELETIAKDPKVDVGGVIIHPDTRTVQAVGFAYLKNEWRIFDPASRKISPCWPSSAAASSTSRAATAPTRPGW